MIKISDAELEIMKVIWHEGKITSIDIIDKMKDSNWSESTIRTLITRLNKKGVIKSVSNKNGIMHEAIIPEEEYRNNATKEFIKKFYNGSVEEFIKECIDKKIIKIGEIRKIL